MPSIALVASLPDAIDYARGLINVEYLIKPLVSRQSSSGKNQNVISQYNSVFIVLGDIIVMSQSGFS